MKFPDSATTTGHPWSPEEMITLVGESEEEVLKRKKGGQGIPTQSIKEQHKLMRFAAHAVCLKRDDKHVHYGIRATLPPR